MVWVFWCCRNKWREHLDIHWSYSDQNLYHKLHTWAKQFSFFILTHTSTTRTRTHTNTHTTTRIRTHTYFPHTWIITTACTQGQTTIPTHLNTGGGRVWERASERDSANRGWTVMNSSTQRVWEFQVGLYYDTSMLWPTSAIKQYSEELRYSLFISIRSKIRWYNMFNFTDWFQRSGSFGKPSAAMAQLVVALVS